MVKKINTVEDCPPGCEYLDDKCSRVTGCQIRRQWQANQAEKFEWDKNYIMDCREALKQFPDDYFELGFTDPPYGLDFKENYHHQVKRGNKICRTNSKMARDYYDDKIDDFPAWIGSWFPELLRICKGVMFTSGMNRLFDYIIYRKPDYQLRIWYKSNADGYNSHLEPFLLYGSIKNYSRLRDCLDFRKLGKNKKIPRLNHPTVKQYDVWRHVLQKLEPKSVLDPFHGSGTTGQACAELGIQFIGFEIKKEYKDLIERRMKMGREKWKRSQQSDLITWIT